MSEISVHVKEQHTCGHMHETIFHMKDASIEGHMDIHSPVWEPAREVKEFTSHVEVEQEHPFELTGNVGRIEVNTCVCCNPYRKGHGWMIKLWRRFRAWLYDLRHPCFTVQYGKPQDIPRTFSTVPDMSEWPPIDFDVDGPSIAAAKAHAESTSGRFSAPLDYSAHFKGKITDHNFLADLFKPLTDQELQEHYQEPLKEVAYALYLVDYNATHPSLGRPLETWDELSEDEQAMYLRYVNTVLKKQEERYGATVKRMEADGSMKAYKAGSTIGENSLCCLDDDGNAISVMKKRAQERENERVRALGNVLNWGDEEDE